MQTKTLAILFADIQGFTSRTSCQTREETQLFVWEINAFIEKYTGDHRGSLVKTMGDGFLLTFECPTDAVKCGIEIQKNIEKRNAVILDANCIVRFRIGISTGEVSVSEKGDVFGDAVNIAARIEAFADPNTVYISETTYLAMNKNELNLDFEDHGDKKFKNVTQEIRVYRAVTRTEGKAAPFYGRSQRRVNRHTMLLAASLVLVVVSAVFLYGRRSFLQDPDHPESVSQDPISSAKGASGPGTGVEARGKVPGEDGVPTDPAAGPGKKAITNFLGMNFVPVAPGSFFMGSPPGEAGRDSDEEQHEVTISENYYIQETEVTVGHWRTFVSETGYRTEAETNGGTWFFAGSEWEKDTAVYWDNPGFSQSEKHPVTCLSLNDVNIFITWINRKDNQRYRLPTEAEWEYSCRGGTETARFWGGGPETACDYANVYDLSSGNSVVSGGVNHDCDDGYQAAAPTGSFRPNDYGLYDMLGNVWEWCSGKYEETGSDATAGNRIFRGGGWRDSPEQLRSANRRRNMASIRMNDLGFRLAMTP